VVPSVGAKSGEVEPERKVEVFHSNIIKAREGSLTMLLMTLSYVTLYLRRTISLFFPPLLGLSTHETVILCQILLEGEYWQI
jgi:hypothetical protein